MFERGAQGEELAERIPAQIAFLLELLHVLGRRAAGTGLEQPAARHQRNDRQHLGRGAKLHDREQIGQIVAQHVAGDGDRVLPLADAIERELHRLDRRQDADVEPRGILLLQVFLDLGDHLGVMRALGVQPEHRRGVGEARAAHPELDPVLDRRVLDLAHAEDVAGLDRTLQQHRAVVGNDADGSARGTSNVLSCEPYSSACCAINPTFGTDAHRPGVERAVRLTVLDDRLIQARVAAIRDHGLRRRAACRRRPTCGRIRGSSPASKHRRSHRLTRAGW